MKSATIKVAAAHMRVLPVRYRNALLDDLETEVRAVVEAAHPADRMTAKWAKRRLKRIAKVRRELAS